MPEGNLRSLGKSKNKSSSITPLPNLISLSRGSTSEVASAMDSPAKVIKKNAVQLKENPQELHKDYDIMLNKT